jgi:hypothetical protein
LQNQEIVSAGGDVSDSAHAGLTRALKRAFSFPTMLGGLLAVVSVLTARSRLDDPDIWWHLKTGEIIWKTHTIPLADVFSYTTHNHALIPQEWLAEVTICGAYQWGALTGLMAWLCLFTALLLISGYVFCSLYSGNSKVAFVGALVIWWFSTVGLSVRPQMIGYVLFVAELAVIHLGRTRDSRWFFGLPILFAIWINCHASFILGMVVAGIYLFSSFFSFRSGSLEARRWDTQCRRGLALSLVLSAGALFLNPTGIRQVWYPFDTILNMSTLLRNVDEWKAAQMTDGRGIALMAVLLCLFVLVMTRRSELFWDEFLLLVLATWMAVSHQRMMVFFGILAAPILCRQLSTLWDAYDAAGDRIWPNAVMLGISALVVILAFPSSQNLEQQVEDLSPVKAVQFIRSSHLQGPMLNDYGAGGYMIWTSPELPVFIDSRTDLYEWAGVLDEYVSWMSLQSDPRALLQKYGINFCLLDSHSSIIKVLIQIHEWKIVYTDKNFVILVRTAPDGPAVSSASGGAPIQPTAK